MIITPKNRLKPNKHAGFRVSKTAKKVPLFSLDPDYSKLLKPNKYAGFRPLGRIVQDGVELCHFSPLDSPALFLYNVLQGPL